MSTLSPAMRTALDMIAHRNCRVETRTSRDLGWVADRTVRALEQRGLAVRDLYGANWTASITHQGREVVRDHRRSLPHPWVVFHARGQGEPIGCWTSEAAHRLPGQIARGYDPPGTWRVMHRDAYAADAMVRHPW